MHSHKLNSIFSLSSLFPLSLTCSRPSYEYLVHFYRVYHFPDPLGAGIQIVSYGFLR